MDATNRLRSAITAGLLFGIFGIGTLGVCHTAHGQASVRTQNFLISASSPQLAQAVGKAAEQYRSELAVYWLGYELSSWQNPCPIKVISGPQLDAQGVTHYDIQPVRNFRMEVVGTPERILDSVLPHEITHTILATHFGKPLPRWADEGVCTIVEHEAEKSKHEAHLRDFLRTQRGIAMNKLFLLREYPDDIHPMYAQGYSVCRFLIEQQGPRTFIQFLEKYTQHRKPSWTDAVRAHYGYESLAELQQYWLKWVADGSGPVERYAKAQPAGGNPSGSQGNIRLAAASGNPAASPSVRPRVPGQQTPASAGAQQTAPRSNPIDSARTTEHPSVASGVNQPGSWYQRRRNQVATGTASARPTTSQQFPENPTRPLQPHVVTQPQREYRMVSPPTWAPQPAASATKWR